MDKKYTVVGVYDGSAAIMHSWLPVSAAKRGLMTQIEAETLALKIKEQYPRPNNNFYVVKAIFEAVPAQAFQLKAV